MERRHIHAVPEKSAFRIEFPRVEGYTQAIRNRISADLQRMPSLTLDPGRIPPEVQMKAMSLTNKGKPALYGPGRLDDVSLAQHRNKIRVQEMVFDIARGITRRYAEQPTCEVPSAVLFPQVVAIVARCVKEKVHALPPNDIKDLFLAPYYGWFVESLNECIGPDERSGETPEVPIYESSRGPGSTDDVDFWTSRVDKCREVIHSHVNLMVAHTTKWEQSAAFYIDRHPATVAFVKNEGLGFAIPYLHNGQMHDYLPDFIIRLKSRKKHHLVIETKGYDPLEEVKTAAAERWVRAVNADGRYGKWSYAIAKKPEQVNAILGGFRKPD